MGYTFCRFLSSVTQKVLPCMHLPVTVQSMWHNEVPHVAGLHNHQTFTANDCGLILEGIRHHANTSHSKRKQKQKMHPCSSTTLFLKCLHDMQKENSRHIISVLLLKIHFWWRWYFLVYYQQTIVVFVTYIFYFIIGSYYSSVHDIIL